MTESPKAPSNGQWIWIALGGLATVIVLFIIGCGLFLYMSVWMTKLVLDESVKRMSNDQIHINFGADGKVEFQQMPQKSSSSSSAQP